MSSFSFTASNDSGIVVTGGGTSISMQIIDVAGPPGPAGATGQGTALSVTFAWGDATPALIASVPAGKTVFKVEVVILTTFDTPSILTVGDSSDNSRHVGVNDTELNQVGGYQTNPNLVYVSTTDVNLYITPGVGNTQGNGLILLYIQE